jgi:hypothetical protein
LCRARGPGHGEAEILVVDDLRVAPDRGLVERLGEE